MIQNNLTYEVAVKILEDFKKNKIDQEMAAETIAELFRATHQRLSVLEHFVLYGGGKDDSTD